LKSFSNTFASDAGEQLARVQAAVDRDPQALFTDFQWFLWKGRDTVFYTAFSTDRLDKEKVKRFTANLVHLAPQLTHGYVGARAHQPYTDDELETLTTVTEVDSLDDYPQAWLGMSSDLFLRDRPLFRVDAVVRRGGPDELGRHSAIQVRAAHALMEGSDAALLTRSQSASHGTMSDKSNRPPLFKRVVNGVLSFAMAMIYLVWGPLVGGSEKPVGFAAIAIDRHRLRRIANGLGITQRALYFALVTHAVNGGTRGRIHGTRLATAYTRLGADRSDTDDDFFRVRNVDVRFRPMDDFAAYARHVEETIKRVEAEGKTGFQSLLNGMFRVLRGINGVIPALPPNRMWRWNGGVDVILTLVPPHRTAGIMTEGFLEPIWSGAYHPSAALITFSPGREKLAISFSMEKGLMAGVGEIEGILAGLEAGTRS
jgi:hypothetical protein